MSVPSAHFPVPRTRTETGPPSSSLRLGIRGGGGMVVEGGGGWRGTQPVEGQQRAERVWARRVRLAEPKRRSSVGGRRRGLWHCQQGWVACSPRNALTEDGPDLKVQARLPCRPVAQGPVSSGRPGPCCIRGEKGGSVGPVRPLLPGGAVQFSLTCQRSNSARAFVRLFFFVSRASVCCSTAATPTHTQTQW